MKKWLLGGVAVFAVAVVALIAGQLLAGLRPSGRVGFQLVGVPDHRAAPLTVAIWYPTEAAPRPALLGLTVQYVATNGLVARTNLPLVVISHGTGGGPGGHADTALALASAGFVVAAPMHTGDNYADQSAVGTSKWLVERSRHVPLVIDYLLERWPDHDRIDPSRIGVFGFSAGGFTALTTIGGIPDMAMIARHCATRPEFACQLWNASGADVPASAAFVHDTRVKAAVVAAPGYGFAFTSGGLANVTAPVQLWSGALDTNVPTASNAAVVQAALGPNAELHVVPNAQHLSFLAPCALIGPPALCREGEGFDRKAFHEAFNQQVVKFFEAKLKVASP